MTILKKTFLSALCLFGFDLCSSPVKKWIVIYHFTTQGNPIFTHKYTADPAALVLGDTLWLFTGHDF